MYICNYIYIYAYIFILHILETIDNSEPREPTPQADLKAGRLPAVVAQLFPAASQPSKSNEPKPKRRRV